MPVKKRASSLMGFCCVGIQHCIVVITPCQSLTDNSDVESCIVLCSLTVCVWHCHVIVVVVVVAITAADSIKCRICDKAVLWM